MGSILGSLLVWVLGLFGFGKPDPEKTGEQVMAGKEAQNALANVAQAQHIQNDVPLDGPLAQWVRDRAAGGH